MIPITRAIVVLVTHYIADFLLQTRWMADNKSKLISALSLHVVVYTIVLMIGSYFILDGKDFIIFSLINGVFHFMTDFFTSKATSFFARKAKEYEKTNSKKAHIMWYLFFGMLGLDQLIHGVTLLLTLTLFNG